MSFDCLAGYENFLRQISQDGYVVWDFKTFVDSDKNDLPEKLAVLRHDIHHRDIIGGYRMAEIENEVLGNCGTSFVQYGFRPVKLPEREVEMREDWQIDYADYIRKGLEIGIDMQPHISPYSMCYDGSESFFAQKSGGLFTELFDANYERNYARDEHGDRLARELSLVGKDVLGLFSAIEVVKDEIVRYAEKWRDKFGVDPQGYSAHGESSINKIIVYDANSFLDDIRLVESGIYGYTSNAMSVCNHLGYISDNYDDDESIKTFGRKFSETDPRKGKRFQVLIHPAKWFRQ